MSNSKNNSIALCSCHGVNWYYFSNYYILMKELLNDATGDIMLHLLKLTTSHTPTHVWICVQHDDTWKTTGYSETVYHCGDKSTCARMHLGCINNPNPWQLSRMMSKYGKDIHYVYNGDNCYDESGNLVR